MEMDFNSDSFEKQILHEIENKWFLKAIELLTIIIKFNPINGTESGFKYHLMRSYCYYKLGSKEALDRALEDVFAANKLFANRFQSYLIGCYLLNQLIA